MSKIVFLLVISCLCLLQVLSQEDRIFCQNLSRECLREERSVGSRDDLATIFNNYCRHEIPTWRDLTRCQLVQASCWLTMVRCDNMTCTHTAEAVQRS